LICWVLKVSFDPGFMIRNGRRPQTIFSWSLDSVNSWISE
jgi:hypothetical protein